VNGLDLHAAVNTRHSLQIPGESKKLHGAQNEGIPQLGTVTSESDESGVETQRALAYPYGTPRYEEGTGWSRHGYTGMERDAGTGLQLHGARWLDTRTARFATFDPKYWTLVPPVGLSDVPFDRASPNLRNVANSATYVLANPTVFCDILGFDPVVSAETQLGVVLAIGGALTVAGVALAAPAVATVGGLMLLGTAVGAIGDCIYQVFKHDELIDEDEVIRTAANGGIAGAVGAVAEGLAGVVAAGITLPALSGAMESDRPPDTPPPTTPSERPATPGRVIVIEVGPGVVDGVPERRGGGTFVRPPQLPLVPRP